MTANKNYRNGFETWLQKKEDQNKALGIQDFLDKTGYKTVDKEEWMSTVMADDTYIGIKVEDTKSIIFVDDILVLKPFYREKYGTVEITVIEINNCWWLLTYNLLFEDGQPQTYILSPLEEEAQRNMEEVAYSFHELQDVHVVPN